MTKIKSIGGAVSGFFGQFRSKKAKKADRKPQSKLQKSFKSDKYNKLPRFFGGMGRKKHID